MDTDTSFRLCWQRWCQYLGPIENADLADICEVSSAAVTGWLNGSRKPRANKISRLSNFIYELITDRKVVIAPHNRSDFTTICTTYQHLGEFPTASTIRATFEGNMTVEQVLGLTSISDGPKLKPTEINADKTTSRLLKTYAISLSVLALTFLVIGVTLLRSGAFTASTKPPFQHSELALSVDGEVRKISPSNDGLQHAFLWKPLGNDNFDVYLVDKQQVITPLLQSSADELGLDWSPNSNTLALLRITQEDNCEFILFSIETHKETLLTECNRNIHSDFVWSRDGERLYFTSRDKPQSPSAVYSYSFSDSQIRQLTFPKNASYGDYRIIESLSGTKLAFLRSDRWSYSELRILNLASSKDELFYEFDQIVYTMNWGFDDDEIFVVPWQSPNQIEGIRAKGQRRVITNRSRPIGDFELNVDRQEIVVRESLFTEDILKTTFDYVSNKTKENLLDNDTDHFNTAKPIITSTRSDWQPKLSPDNQTLAFLSNRSGATELWISDPHGGSARPLTQGEVMGMRMFDWSPDGDKIVVDSSDDRIYVLTVETADIKPFSSIGFVAKNPSWASDNKSIYVASDTNQNWQIWAIDNALSSPRQITHTGGYTARESSDGRILFYTRFYHDGIWELPLSKHNDLEATGHPKNIIESLKPGAWLQWQLSDQKIYFIERDLDGFRLTKYDLSIQKTTKLLELPSHWRSSFSFFVSSDEKDFYFSEKTNQLGDEYLLIR